jgi:hypothetical protein
VRASAAGLVRPEYPSGPDLSTANWRRFARIMGSLPCQNEAIITAQGCCIPAGTGDNFAAVSRAVSNAA